MRTTTSSMLARWVGFLSLVPALQACSSEPVEAKDEALQRSSAALVEKHTWVKVHDGKTPVRPAARTYSATAYDIKNQVTLVYAGHDYPLQNTYVDLWAWDGHTWQKREQGASRPSLRGFPTGTYDEKRGVFVMAGGVGPGLDYRNDVWAWDGTAWTELPEKMLVGRGNCQSVYDPVKDLLLLPAGLSGGTISQSTSVRKGLNWDLPTFVFPTERLGFALVYDPVRKIVLLDGGSIVSTDSMFWNDANETWDPLPTNLKTFRYGHRIVFDSDRNRLIMSSSRSGGNDNSSVDEKFYEWNGTAWNAINAAHPPYRTEASLTYDRARKRVVYFGGSPNGTSAPFNDTWEYDPAVQAWAEVNVVPPPTDRPAAAYDEARKRSVVLSNNGTETWLWDGQSWAHALPRTTAHPKANSLAMAYDPVRKQVVTFGGHDGVNSSDETWLWDGGDWKRVDGLIKKPSARQEHMMAWHPGRQVIVMTGGSGEGSTWEWNGTTWTETIPGDFPGHLDAGHMAADYEKNTVAVAGGDTCGTYLYKIIQNSPVKASWDKIDECGASQKYASSASDPVRKRIVFQGIKMTAEWNGAAWLDTSPASMPTVDNLTAMTFDTAVNKAFLFMGRQIPSTFVNEVWAYESVLSGCVVDGDCPGGLVCNAQSECVQGGSGGAGQGGSAGSGGAGSSGASGQGGAGQGGAAGAAGQGGVNQGGTGQGGAGQGGSSGAGQGGSSGTSGQAGSGGNAGTSAGAGAGGDAGTGGEAGSGGSDAGSGGDAGAGGDAGDGGTGGDAGQGGAGQAGAAGDGGAAGVAGQSGAAGEAGSGNGGAGASGGAGSGQGGQAGQGGLSGNSGQSGSEAGGSAGGGGLSGASGQGGAGLLPSSAGLFGVGEPNGAGSCGCRVTPAQAQPSALAAWAPALAWLLRRGNRRSRRQVR